MTTDNDTNFGPVVTTPSAFGTVFQQNEKEMPSLDCDDLFPNPPRQIDESSQDIIPDTITAQDIIDDINNASSNQSLPYTEDKSQDNRLESDKDEDGVCHFDLPDIGTDKSQDTNESQSVEYSTEPIVSERKTPILTSAHQSPEGENTPNRLPLPVVSPALSVSSYYSSAESVSSATSTSGKKKKKKRYCATCDRRFPHKRDLLEHLKMHVDQPSIQLESLPDDNQHVQEYRDRQKDLMAVDAEEEETDRQQPTHEQPKAETPPQNESGGLKLKLKLSGSQNFQVVPINRLTEKSEPSPQPSKKTPPPAVTNGGGGNAQPTLAFDQTKSSAIDENSLENKFFECPTMDGLDQFAEEINTEAADDLLKKLLECGNQQIIPENDWASNTNEFMPLDRLAYMCTVCNANYPDAMRLEDHKRLTGHNFQHPMHPPPPPGSMLHMDMPNNYRLRPPFQPHMPTLMQQHCGPPMNMRPSYPGYPVPPHQHQQHPQQPRFPPAHGFNQAQHARRPPPLYRVPTPHGANPINMAPFAEMNPEMYIPSSNGNMMMNGHFQPNQPHIERPPVFLKARLQRPAQRPRTPGMHERSPNATPSPPVGFPQQQPPNRPRLMGPMHTAPHGPALKKIKQESAEDDCQIISTQPRPDGFPVIQSVQGGATMIQSPKDPIQLNDQITLSFKNKDQNKNPKDVANILATRGITVTHKPKPPTGKPSREDSPKTQTQEAVQKIQLNNSVSIISKKRTLEASQDEMVLFTCPIADCGEKFTSREGLQRHNHRGNNFNNELGSFPCPVADCEENFMSRQGLQVHIQRGHKMGKVSMKALKCKLCSAMFSTHDGLLDHQRKSHSILKTSADELGIPIIDLRNEETKRKLAQLGIVNYIPLNPKSTNGCFGFPIVSVQGAANPNICNMMGMGVNSLLSLGPIKQIPTRKMD